MTQSENIAQLKQIQALKAARDRVLKLYRMMLPLVANLALEGDSLAKYLIAEHDKAQESMALTNMDAHEFLQERTETPS